MTAPSVPERQRHSGLRAALGDPLQLVANIAGRLPSFLRFLGKTFLHHGVAARQFLRSFVLADGIEVAGAALDNGLLKIDLARKQVQPSVRVVEIKTGGIT